MTGALYHYLLVGDNRGEDHAQGGSPGSSRDGLPGGLPKRVKVDAGSDLSRASEAGTRALDPLLTALQSADSVIARPAFDALFRATYVKLVRFAIPYVGTLDAAEDVVGEVFASLWSHRTTLSVRTTLEGYLFGAVRRRAVSMYRQTNRTDRPAPILADSEHWGMGVPTALPDAAVVDHDTRTALWRAIAELPERQREILALRWQSELGWDDIAHALGSTSAAVQMQHSRAIRALRVKLVDYLA